jgi:Coenzyme PQQ synthesis protein D (PqqD)
MRDCPNAWADRTGWCGVTNYRRNPQIEEAPLGGDLMLFDPVKSQFYVLNPTMAYLWRNCDGEKSLDRIVESVPRDFDGTDSRPVAAEMKTALDELLSLGMITGK